MIRLAVTGTDTGVGKTVVSCALISALRARGLTVGAMKPVETGVTRGDADTDAMRLRHATGDADPIDIVCPITYDEPLAPLVAADRAGRPLDVATLDAALTRVAHDRDAVIVEGAGGLLVPFAPDVTFADLATRWALDVVVVAANRLGAINHTVLTVREALRHGLVVRAVALVAPAEVPNVAASTNADTIATMIAPVPVVHVPRLDAVSDLAALARAGAMLADVILDPVAV